MNDETGWFHRRGALGDGGWESIVDDDIPGWQHTGLRVGVLIDGESLALEAGRQERIVVPLAGSFTVEVVEQGVASTIHLSGRASVFDGPTDVLYLSADAAATVRGTAGSRWRLLPRPRSDPPAGSRRRRHPSSSAARGHRVVKCTTSALRRCWTPSGSSCAR